MPGKAAHSLNSDSHRQVNWLTLAAADAVLHVLRSSPASAPPAAPLPAFQVVAADRRGARYGPGLEREDTVWYTSGLVTGVIPPEWGLDAGRQVPGGQGRQCGVDLGDGQLPAATGAASCCCSRTSRRNCHRIRLDSPPTVSMVAACSRCRR